MLIHARMCDACIYDISMMRLKFCYQQTDGQGDSVHGVCMLHVSSILDPDARMDDACIYDPGS